MLRTLTFRDRVFPLRAPFRIARGVKDEANVVTVEVRQGAHRGRGEAVPYTRYGETVESVLAQIGSVQTALEAGMGRDELQVRLPHGAARNALDSALWDLESAVTAVPIWARLGRAAPAPLVTALTIGIDTPEAMEDAARAIGGASLVKVKVNAEAPAERIAAVRRALPQARMIVDPNESWNVDVLEAVQPVLAAAHVDLLEQPLPAGADDDLLGFTSCVPICADEACHVTADLARLRGRYQAINIKLDKTGGLTEAWRLLHAARTEGFTIMVGCMVCSSLSIAPALEVARQAAFIDLDGPWWLREDYPDGARITDGRLTPPVLGFWGTPATA